MHKYLKFHGKRLPIKKGLGPLYLSTQDHNVSGN